MCIRVYGSHKWVSCWSVCMSHATRRTHTQSPYFTGNTRKLSDISLENIDCLFCLPQKGGTSQLCYHSSKTLFSQSAPRRTRGALLLEIQRKTRGITETEETCAILYKFFSTYRNIKKHFVLLQKQKPGVSEPAAKKRTWRIQLRTYL